MINKTTGAKGFLTQMDLIKTFGVKDTKGFCGPLANLYAKEKRNPQGKNFLAQEKSEILQAALSEQKHQADLKKTVGARGELYSAFHDANVPYDVMQTDYQPSEKLLSKILESSNEVFANYPTARGGQPPYTAEYHQIYFRKLPGYNRCSYFNANRPGGEMIDSC